MKEISETFKGRTFRNESFKSDSNKFNQYKRACIAILIPFMFLTIGLVSSLKLMAYVLLLDTPVIGLLTLLASQITDLILCIVNGTTDYELLKLSIAVNILIILLFMNVAMLKYEKEQSKEVIKETGEPKKLTVKEKLQASIFYERAPFKAVWWQRVCVYSILITIIMTLANSDYITLANNVWWFKIYASIAISLEAIEMIATLTVSTFTYEILAIKTIIELFTIGQLINNTEITTELLQKLIYIIIEFGILGYSLARLTTTSSEIKRNSNKELKEIKAEFNKETTEKKKEVAEKKKEVAEKKKDSIEKLDKTGEKKETSDETTKETENTKEKSSEKSKKSSKTKKEVEGKYSSADLEEADSSTSNEKAKEISSELTDKLSVEEVKKLATEALEEVESSLDEKATEEKGETPNEKSNNQESQDKE